MEMVKPCSHIQNVQDALRSGEQFRPGKIIVFKPPQPLQAPPEAKSREAPSQSSDLSMSLLPPGTTASLHDGQAPISLADARALKWFVVLAAQNEPFRGFVLDPTVEQLLFVSTTGAAFKCRSPSCCTSDICTHIVYSMASGAKPRQPRENPPFLLSRHAAPAALKVDRKFSVRHSYLPDVCMPPDITSILSADKKQELVTTDKSQTTILCSCCICPECKHPLTGSVVSLVRSVGHSTCSYC